MVADADLAPWAGVEPATFRLGGERSIQLSYQGRERRSYQRRPDSPNASWDACRGVVALSGRRRAVAAAGVAYATPRRG